MKQGNKIIEAILVVLGFIAVMPQMYKIAMNGTTGIEIGFYIVNLIYSAIAVYYTTRAVKIVNGLFFVKNVLVSGMIIYANETIDMDVFPLVLVGILCMTFFHPRRFELATIVGYIVSPLMLYYGIVSALIEKQNIQVSIIMLAVYSLIGFIEYEKTKNVNRVYAYCNLWNGILFIGAIIIILIFGYYVFFIVWGEMIFSSIIFQASRPWIFIYFFFFFVMNTQEIIPTRNIDNYFDNIDTTFQKILDNSSHELIKTLSANNLIEKPTNINNANQVKTYIDLLVKEIHKKLFKLLQDNKHLVQDVSSFSSMRPIAETLKKDYDKIKTITECIMPNGEQIQAYTIMNDIITTLSSIVFPNSQSGQIGSFCKLYQGQNPKEGEIQQKALYQRILNAKKNNTPLTFFSTVCPSYSHTDGKYDFQLLTSDVGLLTTYHSYFYQKLIKIIQEKHGLQLKVNVVIADVAEGYDSLILQKYANSDLDQYLNINRQTIANTQQYFDDLGLGSIITVVSMLDLYKKNATQYVGEREKFEQQLRAKLKMDKKFENEFTRYITQRSKMITNFITALGADHTDENKITRGFFALAQYLDHFTRMRLSHSDSIIVNHKTSSIPLINQGEKENVFPVIVLDCNAY